MEVLALQRLKDFLAEIKSEKEQANKIIKFDPAKAKQLYFEVLTKIELKMANFNDLENLNVKEILNQRKLIMSNLSTANKILNLIDESIDLDTKIIVLDPYFDKSYSRLIECYIKKDNLHMANYYGNHVTKHFNQETLEKLKNALSLLEEANNKVVNDMAGNYGEMEKSKNDDDSNKNNKRVAKKGLFKFLFAGLIMFGSTISVFLLFKYRYRFNNK